MPDACVVRGHEIMNKELTLLVQPLASTATRLNLKKSSKGASLPVTGSHFGGSPYAEVGEEWPVCPVCTTSLTFICQVDTTSGFHERPEGVALLTFFYCWECFPWGYGMEDEVEGTWVVRTYSEPAESRAVPIFPSNGQPDPTRPCVVEIEKVISFPDLEALEEWSEEAAELSSNSNTDEPWEPYRSTVEALGGLTDYATVVGGYPHCIQSDATPDCDLCEARMRLLVQIDSEDEADIMWGDVGCVYLFHCPQHPKRIALSLQCF
jgi:uncharacterized protein YwqG